MLSQDWAWTQDDPAFYVRTDRCVQFRRYKCSRGEHLYTQLVYWRASGISATGGVTMGAMVVSASDGICGSGPSRAMAST
jgi:hypothetical protein